jgi:hypothetical protein
MAHRLAWLYMTGEWPTDIIDHKNRNGLNNRWDNLREADQELNLANASVQKNNKAKLKGVRTQAGAFTARIVFRKRYHYLGRFKTAEEAHAAYVAKARELAGDFHCAG